MIYTFARDKTLAPIHCDLCDAQLAMGTLRPADGDFDAKYFATCHEHDRSEVWFDIIITGRAAGETVTFGAMVAAEGFEEARVTPVAPGAGFQGSPHYGRLLSVEEMLEHPWIGTFREMLHFVLNGEEALLFHLRGY